MRWKMPAVRTGSACRASCCSVAKVFFGAAAFLCYRGTSPCQGPGEWVSSLPCFSRCGFSAFISSPQPGAWLLKKPGSCTLPCSASALWSRVPAPRTPRRGFGEWETRMQSILSHHLWSRLRESLPVPWVSTRNCGDLVQARTEAGWLMGRAIITPHLYGCKVPRGVGPALVLREPPRAGWAVCLPQQ